MTHDSPVRSTNKSAFWLIDLIEMTKEFSHTRCARGIKHPLRRRTLKEVISLARKMNVSLLLRDIINYHVTNNVKC